MIEINAYPVTKSKREGAPSGLALGPVVGWNRRSTGAVCNIN